jgi:hypothetical protein
MPWMGAAAGALGGAGAAGSAATAATAATGATALGSALGAGATAAGLTGAGTALGSGASPAWASHSMGQAALESLAGSGPSGAGVGPGSMLGNNISQMQAATSGAGPLQSGVGGGLPAATEAQTFWSKAGNYLSSPEGMEMAATLLGGGGGGGGGLQVSSGSQYGPIRHQAIPVGPGTNEGLQGLSALAASFSGA